MRKCSVCAHPQIKEINRLLINGETIRNIADKFGISAASVHRHKLNHLKNVKYIDMFSDIPKKIEKIICDKRRKTMEFNDSNPPQLLCPICNDEYLHHTDVQIYERAEDSSNGIHVLVISCDEIKCGKNAESRVIIDRNMKKNPSERRQGIRIHFYCESCGSHLTLNIAQHKGTTEIWWVHNLQYWGGKEIEL